jgi:hypothetical protein
LLKYHIISNKNYPRKVLTGGFYVSAPKVSYEKICLGSDENVYYFGTEMKCTIALLFSMFIGQAIAINPPKAILESFSADYADVKLVKWKKADDTFEAEFKNQGVKTFVDYNNEGKWTEKKMVLSQGEFPFPAQEDSRKRFPKGVFESGFHLVYPDGSEKLKLTLKNNAIRQELYYDMKGNPLDK